MLNNPTNFLLDKLCRINEKLREQIVCETFSVGKIEYVPCEYKTNNDPPAEGWQEFALNQRVGGQDKHFWFRASFSTPKIGPEQDLFLVCTTGCEGQWDAQNPQGLLYLNGEMVQGLDTNHTEARIAPETDYQLYLYFYTGMFDKLVEMNLSFVCWDRRMEKVYYDFAVPTEACKYLNPNGREYAETVRVLNQAANLLNLREIGSEAFYQSVAEAEEFLDKEFYHGICGRDANAPVVNCIGHTHIDVAWMWTLAQTREKAQRSFATVDHLMDEYPEYKFMSSQPQLYAYVKEAAPELYERIKKRVAEGRWEVEGAMWLEADCNLISGESMVRQILYGKRFMKQEFGAESKALWLPDVFGYSAALPQILKKCGVEHFVTSKISWNETNTMPYDTFYWEGIDGTQVLTSFLTAQEMQGYNGEPRNGTTYVAKVTPSMVMGTWNRYQQKEFNDQTLITFGFGDGGGGPTREMLEQQRRLQYGLPGYPRTEINTAMTWLERSRKNFEENTAKLRRTPKWVGELYLEFHRGTYTSIAKNKKNNRKSEFLLQKAETMSVLDRLLLGGKYPKNVIDDAWLKVLLHQFHDILPGSSIYPVYEDSDKYYAEVREAIGGVVDEKMNALAQNIATEGGVLVYNPLGFARSDIVSVNGQSVETGLIPAMGWKVLKAPAAEKSVRVEGNTVENAYYKLTLDASGRIASLFDKRFDREVFRDGAFGNELQLFEDFPRQYDAWEISNYYKEKMLVLDGEAKLTPVFDGDRAGIRIERTYCSSTIVQTVYLYSHLERIDFVNEIEWHERHQILKAAFPFALHANRATYEIQFGNTERPTHENNSWDAAKFEVCGHKWADISEADYGVSLMNDCKYGFNAEGSTLKQTLLKCATHPNPEADQGHHEFTYSLLPHGGDYRDAETVRNAYAINQPLMSAELGRQNGTLPEEFSLVSCDRKNVVIDTAKSAEDSDALIVRLYEAHDSRCSATLNFGFDFDRVVLCDMMENELETLEKNGRSVSVPVKNFEIVTLKVIR